MSLLEIEVTAENDIENVRRYHHGHEDHTVDAILHPHHLADVIPHIVDVDHGRGHDDEETRARHRPGEEIQGHLHEGEIRLYEGKIPGHLYEGEIPGHLPEKEVPSHLYEEETLGPLHEEKILGHLYEGEILGPLDVVRLHGHRLEDEIRIHQIVKDTDLGPLVPEYD